MRVRCEVQKLSVVPETDGESTPRRARSGVPGDRVEARAEHLVGELEMTRRISPVAVCCSSASVSARLRLSTSDFRSADDRVVELAR